MPNMDEIEFCDMETDDDLHELEFLRSSKKALVSARAEDLRFLCRVQGVSTTFRAVIARSKSLRRIMFKEDDGDEDLGEACHSYIWGGFAHEEWYINPLASRFDFILPIRLSAFSLHPAWDPEKIELLLCLKAKAGTSVDQGCSSASWRDMQLTKIPTTFELEMRVEWTGHCGHSFRPSQHTRVDLKSGATLSEFADAVSKGVNALNLVGDLKIEKCGMH